MALTVILECVWSMVVSLAQLVTIRRSVALLTRKKGRPRALLDQWLAVETTMSILATVWTLQPVLHVTFTSRRSLSACLPGWQFKSSVLLTRTPVAQFIPGVLGIEAQDFFHGH